MILRKRYQAREESEAEIITAGAIATYFDSGCLAWKRPELRKSPTQAPQWSNVLTEEPDAGDPYVRFGGRGGESHPRSYPCRLYYVKNLAEAARIPFHDAVTSVNG